MFDGMRAYHQSEINHTDHAITMLVAVAGGAGAAVLAILFPQTPPNHIHEIAWGLFATVGLLLLVIAISAHRKINADHGVYASFGAEYVRTCRRLGFYEPVTIAGTSTPIKVSDTIGQGKGYRKTQGTIWSFAGVVALLALLFAIFSDTIVT